MTRVCVRLAPGREAPASFPDVTAAEVVSTSWGSTGELCIDFAAELTPVQARRVAIRCQSSNMAEEEARLELDRLVAVMADEPGLTERETTIAAALALAASLLTPGPVIDT